MTVAEIVSKRDKTDDDRNERPYVQKETREPASRRLQIIPFLITLATVALAGLLGWAMWRADAASVWVTAATITAAATRVNRVIDFLQVTSGSGDVSASTM